MPRKPPRDAESETVDFGPIEFRRLQFARWLVVHHRLCECHSGARANRECITPPPEAA